MKETKIWLGDVNAENSYTDFFGKFAAVKNGEKVELNLSCDNVFAVELNGETVAFGSCQNFPFEKKYYVFDLTEKVSENNELKITVWHQGVDTQTNIKQPAYLAFNVMQGDKKLLKSDKKILAAVNRNYVTESVKFITPQLGYSFYFDNTADEENAFVNYAKETGETEAVKNQTENLVLKNRAITRLFENETGFVADMGKETVGFIEIDIDSSEVKETTIAFGERLEENHVPRIIGNRDFSVNVKLKKGNNKRLFPLRRLAGRYLEIFDKTVKINYLGLRIVEYPLVVTKKTFENPLHQKIYDICVYTLKCCMHEHYEDCPWREQALYVMDGRNQMLCGYYAFKDHAFQRANLVMMTKGLLDNGMLNICFPSGVKLPIPSFNLEYLIAVGEYIDYTKDNSIISEVGGSVKKIMSCFDNAVDENGLIPDFGYPCWNFYEWSDYSHNDNEIVRTRQDSSEKNYSVILNLLYCLAYRYYDKIFNVKTDLSVIKNKIVETFFVVKDGLFKLGTNCDKYSVLANSLAVLVDLGGKNITDKLVKGENLIPVTLSMRPFFYDALLKVDKEYKTFIIGDIERRYKKMIDCGATTVWENELGYKDFGNAGSLCHGWSAMPIYYFNLLGIK